MEAVTLIERAREANLTVWVEGDALLVEGCPTPAALSVIETLRHNKKAILAFLGQQRRDEFVPWMLQEWRRVSIPDWRRILTESVNQRNLLRANYARWMLRDILLDPEYHER